MSGDSAAGGSASLYCPEDAEDVVQSRPRAWISFPPLSFSHSPSWGDDSIVDHLFQSELQHPLHSDHHRLCLHPTSRQDSINWILKVHAHYQFKPVTALLSVDYFDRFLFSHILPGSGWPYQLLSVACLSLAAKMEEPYVPLLVDLQILEPRYVFEPKTIQRMELWVMANLNWRLRSITPYDFLDYFIAKLPSSEPSVLDRIIASSSDLILNTIRVRDFWGFSPSIIAAAAVVLAAGGSEQLPDAFYERVNKETLRSCHQLMQEYLLDSCPSSSEPKVRSSLEPHLPASPPSPIGVLDAAAACVSCDTRSDNPSFTFSGTDDAAGEAEPQPKRLRSSIADVQE